jgi:hypothetical protein
MSPRNHQVNGNDLVYELLGEIMQNVIQVIASGSNKVDFKTINHLYEQVINV